MLLSSLPPGMWTVLTLSPCYHELRAEQAPLGWLLEGTAAFAVICHTNEELETVSRSGGLQ